MALDPVQALALVLSSKGDLKSALQAPLDARAAGPAFEALCEEAVLGGSSVESCAELAAGCAPLPLWHKPALFANTLCSAGTSRTMGGH